MPGPAQPRAPVVRAGAYLTVTSENMPLAMWGGPPARSFMKQTTAYLPGFRLSSVFSAIRRAGGAARDRGWRPEVGSCGPRARAHMTLLAIPFGLAIGLVVGPSAAARSCPPGPGLHPRRARQPGLHRLADRRRARRRRRGRRTGPRPPRLPAPRHHVLDPRGGRLCADHGAGRRGHLAARLPEDQRGAADLFVGDRSEQRAGDEQLRSRPSDRRGPPQRCPGPS